MLFWIGNPHDILRALADKRKLEPAGEPSLQNAIEIARAGMRQVRLQVIYVAGLRGLMNASQPPADALV